MIVLCPKALNKGTTLPFLFFQYYLAKTGEKAMLSNKTWDAFRYRLQQRYDSAQSAGIISELRGPFRPEDVKLNDDYTERAPTDHTLEELQNDTRDLLRRREAEIDKFITEEPTKYKELHGVPAQTLNQWFYNRMNNPAERPLIQEFMERYARERKG